MRIEAPPPDRFIEWFRASAPYIHAHRGRTFVIVFGGEAALSPGFRDLVHDVALLHSLGVRLVLVAGARPQIEKRMRARGATPKYVAGRRVTDAVALACVKEATGAIRIDIEALLSMGLPNSPMAGARIRVATGNFVVARPVGVIDGIDLQHTGRVRRVDAEGIRQRLDSGAVVLLSPLGYSATGDVFNVGSAEIAGAAAVALGAEKLVCLVEARGVLDAKKRVQSHLTPEELDVVLESGRSMTEEVRAHFVAAAHAVRNGVRRAHIVDRRLDGGLLLELFSRDGIGTLVSREQFEGVRPARLEDVGGILELLHPLEELGILVRRSAEMVEHDVDRITVIERDGMIVACGALYPYPDERIGELAALAVSPAYREAGRGEQLLEYVERRAREQGLDRLFVLTTQTAHWFRERGFEPARVQQLPEGRRAVYNKRRKSKILIKEL